MGPARRVHRKKSRIQLAGAERDEPKLDTDLSEDLLRGDEAIDEELRCDLGLVCRVQVVGVVDRDVGSRDTDLEIGVDRGDIDHRVVDPALGAGHQADPSPGSRPATCLAYTRAG